MTNRRQFIQAAGATAALPAFAAAQTGGPAEAGAMPRRRLGASGVDVPILHLGTSQRLDPVYDKIMHRCYREGVTMIDTALSYGWGSSHRAVANFLSQIDDRPGVWLTSKSGSREPGKFSAAIDQALDELQTDYLDLYLMHGINRLRQLDDDFIRTGQALKKAGKTRLFGFSCHDGNVVDLMNRAADLGSSAVDAILFRYNFRRYGDRELNVAIDRCHAAGIGLLAMKTMGAVPSSLEHVVRFRSDNFTLAQAKLKSVWADERISSVVSEMDSVRVARENIAAAKSPTPLAAEEIHQLNRLAALTDHHACLGCSQHCERAAPGTAVADALRFLSYAECYGPDKLARARELYRALPEAARGAAPERLARAAAVCPQRIDIAARLADARRLLA